MTVFNVLLTSVILSNIQNQSARTSQVKAV